MIDYSKLAGQSISALTPYKPGKPVKELERELGVTNSVKLASNENPLGCSPKVIAALNEFMPEISRYPLGDAFYLRKAVSEHYGISGDRLLFGTGSNEIIELAIRTFLAEDECVLSPSPSFSVYGIISQAAGKSCKWVPVNDAFKCDFEALANAITDKTRMVFLANPNNPTGEYFTAEELEAFMQKVPEDVIVVMDEAYIEYADAPDFPDTLKMLDKYKNMFLMRTFSKAYGLAALRAGFVIACEEAIDMMNRVRQPFNTNMAAQVAAEAAIKDQTHLKAVLAENQRGKEFLYSEFEKLGLKYVPTQANFILVNVGNGEKVFDNLLKQGVIVRFFGSGLAEWIRVSIGTMEENAIFIEKLKEVL
ncbi:histidinol-phosphate aminotransferase [Denitrovibrio acetiphilus DSM 12809]|uniref:Histidinol-phosphate aminotransferase n=1 Tax=Denitrovibrio acetiphilus (strain DSM 12809 / NBRC 114555 / N2460) TaxID=522772 RepID=D4H703_DENA2|nr:histidinol-phosphate transaminase [Denitrovibrio acetiphilus]ADD69707.1 histidinol-phosphate aminotransferase [Denitrovibrio acetiphilus DSM 12809]